MMKAFSAHKAHASPARRGAPARGFALVVTLSLMILLTLVAVGLLSLSSISLRSLSQGQAMATARANARLALVLALGDLQKHGGPDQRTTARAEIMDKNPASPVVDGVKQPLWTGIWKTNNPDPGANNQLDSGAGPTLRSWSTSQGPQWLVSNPTPATQLDPNTWTGAYPSAITLAKGLGSDALDVAVPLVNVTGGRYGYWVSDEGVKAKVNLIDPTFNSGDAALSQLHMGSSQALPMQTILPMKNPETDFRATPTAEIGKVLDNASVALLSTIKTPLALNTYSPDITTYSYGVLSDIRRGGLKKDLTAAFEDQTNFNTFADTYGNGDRSLYRSGLNFRNDGPLWYSLFYHYNTYKSVMPTPPGLSPNANDAPTSSINIASPPYTLTPRGYKINYPSSTIPTFLNGPLPVVIAYRVDIAIASFFDANDGKWKLQLQFYPQLVLCNPYSARLRIPGFTFGKALDVFRDTILNIAIGGVNTAIPIEVGRFSLKPAGGELDTLDPGETRVFALDADLKATSILKAGTYTALKSAANSAVSADHYQYVDLTQPALALAFPPPPPPAVAPDPPLATVYAAALATTDPNAIVKLALSGPNHSAAGDQVTVTYMDESINPAKINWPGKTSNRYGIMGGNGFTSPAVPNVWTDQTISNMVGARRVLGFFARRKGLTGSNSPANYTHGSTGVPVFIGNSSVLTPFEAESSTQWMEIYLSPFGDLYTNNQTDINTFPNGETSWGNSSVGDDTSGSINRYILRDVPSQPLVSMGQFMHMPTYRFTDWHGDLDYNHQMFGSMFMGGSIIPVNMPVGKLDLTQAWSGSASSPFRRLYLDDSFLANQALFDRFFFSTVPPATLESNAPAYWTQFNVANGGTRLSDSTAPLLNSRIKPYFSGGLAPAMADLRNPEKASSNLMLDGAFNINSTSVPAWKALLSSLSGNRLGIWNATGKTPAILDGTAAKDANPIPRFWSASSTGTPNAPWDGLRVLTDAQVNNLAEQIVTQVKTRGPFLSMADFLNRRLGATSSALTRSGALQAAIDNTSPDINQAAKALGVNVTMSGGLPPVIPANLQDAAGRTLNTAVGMPGYLMQQDLVQAFSPAMTARSDTFVIRTYGECVSPSGAIQAKAWAEAVVQRVPEYIDQSDSQLTAAGNATPAYKSDGSVNVGSTNLQFGRSFKIVQFRWLTPNEI